MEVRKDENRDFKVWVMGGTYVAAFFCSATNQWKFVRVGMSTAKQGSASRVHSGQMSAFDSNQEPAENDWDKGSFYQRFPPKGAEEQFQEAGVDILGDRDQLCFIHGPTLNVQQDDDEELNAHADQMLEFFVIPKAIMERLGRLAAAKRPSLDRHVSKATFSLLILRVIAYGDELVGDAMLAPKLNVSRSAGGEEILGIGGMTGEYVGELDR